MIRDILEEIRIKQHYKDLIVFLPLFFSRNLFNIDFLIKSFLAFISFFLVSSSVYIMNDIFDLEEDKKHPTKKFRPLASGRISLKICISLLIFLLVSSLVISLLTINEKVFIIISLYFIINLFYSKFLKKVFLIDVFIVPVGFLLRFLAGFFSIKVPFSHWALILIFSIAIFLVALKRESDLFLKSKKTEYEVMKELRIVSSSLLIISWIFYLKDHNLIISYLTIPFVLYSMFFLIKFTKENPEKNVSDIILHKNIVASLIIILVILFIELYIPISLNL